ncbi:MAG: hypothetical protein QOG88_1843, partial [Actinomycetota bacterium]|nr:hypothetical protein [Actinomycetota bacterium]
DVRLIEHVERLTPGVAPTGHAFTRSM